MVVCLLLQHVNTVAASTAHHDGIANLHQLVLVGWYAFCQCVHVRCLIFDLTGLSTNVYEFAALLTGDCLWDVAWVADITAGSSTVAVP